jgi:membrane associated rhomboid family serine protease
MLILPFQTRVSLRSAPFVTLALILLNVAVFLFAQYQDDRNFENSLDFYEQSALPQLEIRGFQQWLESRGGAARKQLDELQAAQRDGDIDTVLDLMQGDADFMRTLHELRIVTPENPDFLEWRDQRNEFETLQQAQAADQFLLKRGARAAWRFISYQFFHGDLSHLAGNMIVLLLAGSFAEPSLGRLRFTLGYLLSGVSAGALHLAVTDAPVVGASGAIAGAMAMLGVLFGLRRVPVFLWVLFYFGTVRMPAVWLLPIWIANEVWQWSMSADGTVAYAAHLGGFVFGGAYAFGLKLFGTVNSPKDDPDPTSGTNAQADLQLLLRAEQAAAQIDAPRAAQMFGELAARHPTRADYAVAQFNLARLGEDRSMLNAAMRRVLEIRPDFVSTTLTRAYLAIATSRQREALPFDAQLRLVHRLVRVREDDTALHLLDALLADSKNRSEHATELAETLDLLIARYARIGLKQQSEQLSERRRTLPAAELDSSGGPPEPPHGKTA